MRGLCSVGRDAGPRRADIPPLSAGSEPIGHPAASTYHVRLITVKDGGVEPFRPPQVQARRDAFAAPRAPLIRKGRASTLARLLRRY